MLSFERQRLRLQLNLRNLTGAEYSTRGFGSVSAIPSRPVRGVAARRGPPRPALSAAPPPARPQRRTAVACAEHGSRAGPRRGARDGSRAEGTRRSPRSPRSGSGARPISSSRSGTAEDALAALRLAREAGVPLTFLGGGSNVLVGDCGVRGLVARLHGGRVETLDGDRVRAEAGVTVNGLVRWCIGHGLGGFEAWAGTPGTLGGAVYGNAHFQGRLMSEVVTRACLLTRTGEIVIEPVERLGFAYDVSRLQETGEALLWVEIRVHEADPAALRATAKESLTFRKRTQPLALAQRWLHLSKPRGPARSPSRRRAVFGGSADRPCGTQGFQAGGRVSLRCTRTSS